MCIRMLTLWGDHMLFTAFRLGLASCTRIAVSASVLSAWEATCIQELGLSTSCYQGTVVSGVAPG